MDLGPTEEGRGAVRPRSRAWLGFAAGSKVKRRTTKK